MLRLWNLSRLFLIASVWSGLMVASVRSAGRRLLPRPVRVWKPIFATELEKETFSLINQYRKENKLEPFIV